MARQKSGTELETLRRQQIELAQRIKEAEVKARLKLKADQERRELIAGRAVLAYLTANPEGHITKAILAVLEAAPLRQADRVLFDGMLATQDEPTPTAGSEGVTGHQDDTST